MKVQITVGDILSSLFGLIILAIGLINTFWGNDMVFGICIALASFIYFPPVPVLVEKITGIRVPVWAKIILGLLILWAALGVGELFDKIDLMKADIF